MSLNYIAEINAFERWLETNHLPPSSQLLWYKLISINNRCMWIDWFSVDNLRLMLMIGASSEKTAINARNQLVQNGLIDFKKGKKGCPNKYKIISIHCKYYSTNDSENDSTSDSINAVKMTVQTADINKLNKTKQNNNLSKERFKKPTLEEVKEYCKDRNNGINPQKFIDYYTANGWMVGKNSMKDWKAAVRNWEKRSEDNKPARTTSYDLDAFIKKMREDD